MRLAIILPADVLQKRNKMKHFSQGLRNQPLWCSGQVQSRRVGNAEFESYRIVYSYFLFFPFFVLLFSINIQLKMTYIGCYVPQTCSLRYRGISTMKVRLLQPRCRPREDSLSFGKRVHRRQDGSGMMLRPYVSHMFFFREKNYPIDI